MTEEESLKKEKPSRLPVLGGGAIVLFLACLVGIVVFVVLEAAVMNVRGIEDHERTLAKKALLRHIVQMPEMERTYLKQRAEACFQDYKQRDKARREAFGSNLLIAFQNKSDERFIVMSNHLVTECMEDFVTSADTMAEMYQRNDLLIPYRLAPFNREELAAIALQKH